MLFIYTSNHHFFSYVDYCFGREILGFLALINGLLLLDIILNNISLNGFDCSILLYGNTFEWMSIRATYFSTFFFKFARFMYIQTIFSIAAIREVRTLNNLFK